MHLVDITMFYATEGGGVSTYLNAKARWLAQRSRVRHTILSPNIVNDPAAPSCVSLPGIALPGLNGFRLPLSVGGPARTMLELAPDLVEAGDAGHAALAALRVRKRRDIPAVAFYHSDLQRLVQARLGNAAMRAARVYLAQLYRQFDLVCAPSKCMKQQLDELGVPNAVHQPLGIDVATFSPALRSDALRKALQLTPETRLLVYAGRFTPDKKLALLIDAVRKLGAPYHLLLIGGGASLPAGERISRLPFQRDQQVLARLLASCDALVHPGDCETFGLIVLEAMACGLPVVGTLGGGVGELIDPNTGVAVTPNRVSSLCAGIESLFMRDRAAMGKAAAHKARSLYDWNRIMPQLMNRYAGLLAVHARADLEAELGCVPE